MDDLISLAKLTLISYFDIQQICEAIEGAEEFEGQGKESKL